MTFTLETLPLPFFSLGPAAELPIEDPVKERVCVIQSRDNDSESIFRKKSVCSKRKSLELHKPLKHLNLKSLDSSQILQKVMEKRRKLNSRVSTL
jgi:hypothetical protein